MRRRTSTGSGVQMASLALPLCFAAFVCAWRGTDPRALLTTRTAPLFLVLLIGIASWGAIVHEGVGRIARVMIALGLAEYTLWIGYSFRGTLTLGEGEPAASWVELESGVLRTAPDLSIGNLRIGEEGKATVSTRTGAVDLPGRIGGYRLEVHRIRHAPAISLLGPDGEVIDGALFKIDEEGKGPSYFQSMVLPYRIYLSYGEDGKPGDRVPPILHYRIQRLKMLVAEGEVAPGETVSFEGLGFRFDEGLRWMEIRVRSYGPLWMVILLGAAIGTGCLIRLRRTHP